MNRSRPWLTDRYRRYLRSTAWKQKRRAVFRAQGRRCRECGQGKNATNPLQVNHLTYENLYDENLDDQEVLCRRCHQAHTARTKLHNDTEAARL